MVDASGFRGTPDKEFSPRNVTEVSEIVAEAAVKKVPITVAGSRTGVTGGCCPSAGWLLSLDRINYIATAPGLAFAGAGATLSCKGFSHLFRVSF